LGVTRRETTFHQNFEGGGFEGGRGKNGRRAAGIVVGSRSSRSSGRWVRAKGSFELNVEAVAHEEAPQHRGACGDLYFLFVLDTAGDIEGGEGAGL